MEVDLIIKNVQVFNSYYKKFVLNDVAIFEGKFLHISKICDEELHALETIDGQGKYLVPGLIDIHMHIESSMITPLEFAKAASRNGVTTVVAEPHEIANVFGLEGIEAMMAVECDDLIDIFYGIPSSVPSTSFAFETTGGSITVKDVHKLLEKKRIACLGEVMNFKDLINDKDSNINKIIDLIKSKAPLLPIEGHCPKITGLELSKYIFKGVDGDHTQQTPQSLEEKISNGMFIEIQEKSMTAENLSYLIENELYEHFCFVTDDVMADKLVKAHLNGLVKKAIDMGMSPEMAVYVSTFTPAKRMNLNDRGSIAAGKKANFLLIADIKSFTISSVYKDGIKVDFNKIDSGNYNTRNFPPHFYESVKLESVSPMDFKVTAPIKNGNIKCRIIKVNSESTFTEEVFDFFQIKDNKLLWEKDSCSYCLISVFERYGKNKNRSYGLVGGDIINKGAVATTYAHDHHNLMVMGKSSNDMAMAANWVIENQGGYCVVQDGIILASLKLPIGGILSEAPLAIVAEKLKNVREALKHLGYKHNNEIMSFSTLSLPVSPALKITDKGLIRVKTQEIVDLFCLE